ncbi:MAG: hypothetical protein AAB703_06410 [Pseudomonadota bacterium]
MFPNLDGYSAVSYHTMQIPVALFYPSFRNLTHSGLGAHIIQRDWIRKLSGLLLTIRASGKRIFTY